MTHPPPHLLSLYLHFSLCPLHPSHLPLFSLFSLYQCLHPLLFFSHFTSVPLSPLFSLCIYFVSPQRKHLARELKQQSSGDRSRILSPSSGDQVFFLFLFCRKKQKWEIWVVGCGFVGKQIRDWVRRMMEISEKAGFWWLGLRDDGDWWVLRGGRELGIGFFARSGRVARRRGRFRRLTVASGERQLQKPWLERERGSTRRRRRDEDDEGSRRTLSCFLWITSPPKFRDPREDRLRSPLIRANPG